MQKEKDVQRDDAVRMEELSRFFCEQAVDSIFIVDLKGIILYANKAAINLVNIPPKDYVGRSFRKFVHKSSMKKAWASFRRLSKKKVKVDRDEMNILDKKGNIVPVEFTSSPIYRDGKIVQVLAVVRDISRRKEVERLMRESEKMKAAANIITGTAKEIQYPLKGLLDRAQGLIENYKNRDYEYIGYKEFKDILDTLEIMRDQVKYCFDTTNRLLDLQKRKAGLRKSYCDVNKVVREAIKSVEHQLEVGDIKLQTKLNPKLPLASMQNIELTEIMTNILNNAIQSITKRGNIAIKTFYRKTEREIKIICKDDGIGIPKDTLSRIFVWGFPLFIRSSKHIGERSTLKALLG